MRNLKTSTCLCCNIEFKHGSDVWGKFCSMNCKTSYKRIIYENQPKSCKQCNKNIPYEQRANNFCSRSCSATYTNPRKDRKPKPQLKPIQKSKEPTIKQCSVCNTEFISKSGSHKFCSMLCKTGSDPVKYRKETRFKLNKRDHLSLFNSELIQKYGWYMSANRGDYNPEGVCWDHLYRVEDGFKNQVKPEIMKHPANAELVPWRVNYYRKQSMITLEQLLERIKLWDEGRANELEYFYVD